MTKAPAARKRRGKKKKKSALWARHPDDWYVEPTWVSASIFAVEKFEGRVWDPACGLGRIVVAAQNAGLNAIGTDLVARAGDAYEGGIDFLKVSAKDGEPNIVSNIPFGIAQAFVEKCLQLADRKVALLLPAGWLLGEKRSAWLETTPLRRVWFITPRPSMPPGPVVEAGIKPGNGSDDFAWFVWLKGYDGAPEIRWIRRDEVTRDIELPSNEIPVFKGSEEMRRDAIKLQGQLETPNGLPLFKPRKPVVRSATKGASA